MFPMSVEKLEDGKVLLRMGEADRTNMELILMPEQAMILGGLLYTASGSAQPAGEVTMEGKIEWPPVEKKELDKITITISELVPLTEPDKDGDPYAATMRREIGRFSDSPNDDMECPHCNGCGTYEGGSEYMFTKCQTCDGTGVVSRSKFYGPGSGSHTQKDGWPAEGSTS